MKSKLLISLLFFSAFFTSCKYNDVFINPYDQNADTAEIQKICDRSEAECGYISGKYRNSIIELFCGECSDGYECKYNRCQDIDECSDLRLNNCPVHSDCHNLDMKSDGKPYECICNENYSGDDCVPDSREQECTDLPANAEWNSVSSIDQTWNGSDWIPSTKGEYSEETSEIECHFKCKNNFEWNGSECEDKTEINDEDSVEDDDDDLPDGDADSSASDDDIDTTPTTPCTPNPCNGIANSTNICTVTENGYSCGCDDGFFWNGSECKKQITLGNICTGQNRCYNNTEEISCPTSETADFYGQDAQYAKAGYCYPQSFTLKTVSGQNIVVDNNTGLEWQQVISEDIFNWDDAVSHCESLEYAGYTDWRLPTALELLTIVDNSKYGPAIDSAYFPNRPNAEFWTSTLHVNIERAWKFSFNDGFTENNTKADSFGVQCVRGNELHLASFTSSTINGDAIVEDSTTGLMWQGTLQTNKTWQESLDYCENLTYAGYSDWRVPNRNEITSLVNYGLSSPASDFPSMIPAETTSNWFKSSTTTASSLSKNWSLYAPNGAIRENSNKSTANNVRCVRSEKINDPCNPNPCNGISNSTGNCTVSGSSYICGCKSDYTWTGSTCKKLGSLTLGNICTGQNKCYNNTEEITCPTSSSTDFYGQDAWYASLGKCTPQSFSSSTNVVVDNNTGLSWEKSPSEDFYTWDDAPNHCADLNSSNYGGKSNWRVPNPFEFMTIVDNSKYNPATNSNFTNMPSDDDVWFWTSAKNKGRTDYAYYFSPSDGDWSDDEKTEPYKVLCVSGDEMQPATSADFTTQTISGSVVVTDSKTGLMWQKEYVEDKTWKEALKYCENLTYAGYSDWRLPNKNELSSLINYEKSVAPYSYFPDMPSGAMFWFWSSSTEVTHMSYALLVDFDSGKGVGDAYKPYTTYVRCVR